VEHLLAGGRLDSIMRHEQELTQRLLAGLHEISGIAVHGPAVKSPRVGVISLTPRGHDPQEFAAILDASAGIQTRSGLHCAPRMHRALGTIEGGGTVRLSVGHANTHEQIEKTLEAIRQLSQ
jgi:selenocysteine lyase/cysteine desulfurase